MMNEKKYCYRTTLKIVYGLTESWIKRLGEPDKVVPNPHRRSTNSYLYLRERVEMFIEEKSAIQQKRIDFEYIKEIARP